MNVSSFLNNYQITENPFRAEEARHDSIFSRIETACYHPDFEKICGDFDQPASSIVFGEKGSGKTAIRLQIEERLKQHNEQFPERKCLSITYDELNPVLDRFSRDVDEKSPTAALRKYRLVDHIDAMMNAVVPKLVDQACHVSSTAPPSLDLGQQKKRVFRKLSTPAKRDLMTLQTCYDRPDGAAARTSRLKRAIGYRALNRPALYRWVGGFSAFLAAAGATYFILFQPQQFVWLWYTAVGLLLLLTGIMAGRVIWLWWNARRYGKELAKELRVMNRSASSFCASLQTAGLNELFVASLPRSDDDDLRYAMFDRLMNIIRPLGYQSILVLVDRVDEPTLINGEPDRMRDFIWPMLNNKFLQQDHVAIKLLLPLELRHLLNRETTDFFREARLDKQNMIERLTWSGATLYDLCGARLNACRPNGEQPMSLREFFDEDVTHQDLIDALDQMQQPRDAFKLLYQLIQEHCANVPEEQPKWTIPRPVLDGVRKLQVERMSSMLRGVRPA